MTGFDYVTDGAAIYRESFSIIRAESDLGRFSTEEEVVAVRMIHAAGQTDLAGDIVFSPAPSPPPGPRWRPASRSSPTSR